MEQKALKILYLKTEDSSLFSSLAGKSKNNKNVYIHDYDQFSIIIGSSVNEQSLLLLFLLFQKQSSVKILHEQGEKERRGFQSSRGTGETEIEESGTFYSCCCVQLL